MAQTINTNIPSLNAQRNLNNSQSALATSLQRLSSGLRINSAKDDAAGLSIADRMTSQIRGLNQAARNANDGISLSQTAEGALSETNNILQRVRELAIQSANSSNSASDRRSLQSEVNQLVQEMDRIASTTTFNGLKLLDGSFTSQQFQVGAEANQSIAVSVGGATTQQTGVYQVNDTNATAGIRTATQGQTGSTDATAVMNIATAASTAAAANLIAAQTLTITAPDNTTQTLSVASGTSAKVIAADLSTKSGVSATATNAANIKLTSNEAQNGERVSFDLTVDSTKQTVAFVRDSTIGTLDAQLKTAISSAFSAYSDVSTAINSSGGVDVTSAAGGNIQVESFKVQEKAAITLGTFANFAKDTGVNVTVTGSDLTNANAGWKANVSLTSLDGATVKTHEIGVTASAKETFTVTGVGAGLGGETLIFDGLTVTTAASATAAGNATSAAIATAFTSNGGYAAWNWTVGNAAGVLTFTHKTAGAYTDVTDVKGAGTFAGGLTTYATTLQGSAANITVDGTDTGQTADSGTIATDRAALATKIAAAFTPTELTALGLSTTVENGTGGSVNFKALGASGAAGVTFTSQGVTGSTLGSAAYVVLTAGAGAAGTYVSTNTATGTAASTLANTTANAYTAKATNLVNFTFNNTTDTLTDTVNIDLTGVDLSSNAKIAAQLNTALANKQTIEVVGYTAGDSTVSLRGKDYDKALTIASGSTTTADAANATAANLIMAAANSDTSFNNVKATTTSTVINLDTTAAYRIDPTNAAGTEAWESLDFNGASVAEALNKAGTATGGNVFGVKTGSVAISLDPSYSIASSVAGSAAAGGIFNGSLLSVGTNLGTTTAPDLTAASGLRDVSLGNFVNAQNLTVKGEATRAVVVDKDSSAKTIAAKINQVADATGVTGLARSSAQIGSLSADGTVSMTLFGANTSANPVSVSAGVTTTNVSALVTAINQKSAQTGITASLDVGNAGLTLTSATGDDIKIQDFRPSAAVTDTSGGGTQNAVTMKVTGEAGSGVTLSNGGTSALALQSDSTVVGGRVTFNSSKAFTVTSDVAGTAGSLFTGSASVEQGSAQQLVSAIDISSAAGANAAVSVIDGALAQIAGIRADLGAIQNRFSSTIASLAAGSENISAARSRIQDADFAAETASLTRNQILQQAGIAMLAQANALPQSVLSLLK